MKLKKLAAIIGIIGLTSLVLYASSNSQKPTQPVVSPATTQAVLPLTQGNNTATSSPTSAPTNKPTTKPQLANTPAVNGTEQIRKALINTTVTSPEGEAVLVHEYKTAAVPNDPFSSQWWRTSMGINQFWDLPAPTKQTVVAIIDTGIALNHQEFSGRLYQNPGETGPASSENPSLLNCTSRGLPLSAACNLIDENVDGIVDNETGSVVYQNPSRLNCTAQGLPLSKSCNNIDDDNNGYVDDVNGWDFVNFDNKPLAGELNIGGSGIDHGTMVAGIAAGNANNGVGTAGVDWYTKILPLQAIDDDSYGNTLSVARAVRYAADMGADVINLSLGTSSADSYLLSAIEYAIDKNVVVVAAAGNTDCNCMIYPAAFDATLSVGALNTSGVRASFSSYGSSLDVMAPGVSITSSTATSGNFTSAYATGNGTSYAAPFVSGMVARLKGVLPTATVTQLTALVTEQTKEVQLGQTTKSTTNGFGSVQANQSAVRATTSISANSVYAYSGVSDGGLFGTISRPTLAYACEGSKVGTTTLYKITNASKTLYSLNPIDKRKASLNGYTTTSAFAACVLQPQDTAPFIRLLNTPLELDNVLPKNAGL